jgi:heptosyltransferase-2/heptosyltransferase-3
VLHYAPSPGSSSTAASLWQQHDLVAKGPILALAPGSAQPARRWFGDRFAKLARRWVETTHGMVFVIGSAGERSVCETVCRDAGDHTVNLAGAGDIAVAAALLQRADLFVGNDSGLAHLAAAVGTPTIVISGPGDPTEIAPYTPQAISVEKPVFCSPCHKGTCWRTDKPLECLDLVSIDDVWVQMQKFVP